MACSCSTFLDTNYFSLEAWSRAISELFCAHLLISRSASASVNLLWAALSLRTANSAFRSRWPWRYCLSDVVLTLFKSRSPFPLTNVLQTLATDSLPCTVSWCLRTNLQPNRTLAPVSQCWIMNLNSTTLVQCLPPNVGCYCRSLMKMVRILRDCDFQVIRKVEAVYFWKGGWSACTTADVDAGLGFITRGLSGVGQMTRLSSQPRSCAVGSPDSSHEQWTMCQRRWRGTECGRRTGGHQGVTWRDDGDDSFRVARRQLEHRSLKAWATHVHVKVDKSGQCDVTGTEKNVRADWR